MAQNITLMGASYSDVPAVTLPKTGGGIAQFDDTSDGTAVASDIADGKIAYVNGQRIVGTASGGGGSAISIVDTLDSSGGTIRTITAVNISDTTAVASDVLNSKWFYTADGTKTQGTATGGGSSAQTATGTVTGSGTIQLQISCQFAPDLIYVYGDLSGSASYRGIVSFTIIKDTMLIITNDGSTSGTSEVLYEAEYGIAGYGSSSSPHATYSNGTLTLDVITDSSSSRFNSSITYSYKLVKWSS